MVPIKLNRSYSIHKWVVYKGEIQEKVSPRWQALLHTITSLNFQSLELNTRKSDNNKKRQERSSTLMFAMASISENDTLAVELALRMKVPTTTSWLSMPKPSYKKLCYNTLNNPYWHEKGLTANFDLPEKSWLHFQIDGAAVYAKCRGCRQLHRRNSSCNMESPILAPPIHANNQAMQQTAYSQWH